MARTAQLRAMPQMLLCQEPGWRIERRGDALLLRRDSDNDDDNETEDKSNSPKQSPKRQQRVRFRYEVEVREYEREEDYTEEYLEPELIGLELSENPLAMCASAIAAICVTLVLPWLLTDLY